MEWLAEIVNPLSTVVAAFAGAWLAFRNERKQKAEDEVSRRIGAANRALATLANMWNNLEQYERNIIKQRRSLESVWLHLPATPPLQCGLVSIEAGELDFLLSGPDPAVYMILLQEEQRFRHVMALISSRSELLLSEVQPKLSAAGFGSGSSIAEDEFEKIVGHHVVAILKSVTPAILNDVPDNMRSHVTAFKRLRSVVKSTYPDQKLISVPFEQAGYK